MVFLESNDCRGQSTSSVENNRWFGAACSRCVVENNGGGGYTQPLGSRGARLVGVVGGFLRYYMGIVLPGWLVSAVRPGRQDQNVRTVERCPSNATYSSHSSAYLFNGVEMQSRTRRWSGCMLESHPYPQRLLAVSASNVSIYAYGLRPPTYVFYRATLGAPDEPGDTPLPLVAARF